MKSLRNLLLWVVLAASLYGGWKLRVWHWYATDAIHCRPDIENAMKWGRRSAAEGWLNLYDTVFRETTNAKYGLDYPPLRLGVVTVWGHYLKRYYPDVTTMQSDINVYWPFLVTNTLMELAAMVAIFLLVRQWTGGLWLATAAALWFWFNPAVLISTWGRPAGDIWIVPFYLLAVWLGCKDRWFTAGAVLAVGAMLKGQQLIMLPVFVAWLAFAGHWRGLIRFVAGAAIAASIVVSPWLLTRPTDAGRVTHWPAILWIASLITGLLAVRYVRRWRIAWIALAAVIAMLPAYIAGQRFALLIVILLSAIVLPMVLCRIEWKPAVAAFIGFAMFLCIQVFSSGNAWFQVAYEYGSRKYPLLNIAESSGLAGILAKRYRWQSSDVAFTLFDQPVTIYRAMAVGCLMLLLLAALAMRLQQRRRDPAFLIALACPWLLYFTFAPQMHERYLLWATGAAACVVGLGVGWTLLASLVAAVSWIMTAHNLLLGGRPSQFGKNWSPDFGDKLLRFIDGTHPDIGWLLMLVAAIFLYAALLTRLRKSPQKSDIMTFDRPEI